MFNTQTEKTFLNRSQDSVNQKENESRECEAHNSSKPRTTLFLQKMGCATCVCVCVCVCVGRGDFTN